MRKPRPCTSLRSSLPQGLCLAVALASLLCLAPEARAQSGAGRLVVTPTAASVGEEVEVEVRVADVSNVAAFQATLTWNPQRLAFVEGRLGPFLETSEREVTFVPPFGEPGRLTFAAYSTSEVARPGASGEGLLFSIRLRARRAGLAEVSIEELLLADTSNEPIPLAPVSPVEIDITQPPTIYLPATVASAPLR